MKGAREYAELFGLSGQYGRLYIQVGEHVRGKTFNVWVLPKRMTYLQKDAVMVYGAVAGNPGWDEEYGWLYEGKWQDDFYQFVEVKKSELSEKIAEQEEARRKKEEEEKNRIFNLLSDY